MRFHRSESAFALLMSVILAAALTLLFLYLELTKHIGTLSLTEGQGSHMTALSLVLIAGSLQACAVCIGAFLIYPLIRTQVREEGKLRQMTASLSARSQTLEHAALTDGLTGMHNRRYFDDALKEYLGEFGRIERPIGLMILDLDHFKQVNDTYGHDIGDEVLRTVSTCLKDMTRYHDIVARLGGEEFAIVAPNMDLKCCRALRSESEKR
jgi:GGDEF domain-containing protein